MFYTSIKIYKKIKLHLIIKKYRKKIKINFSINATYNITENFSFLLMIEKKYTYSI